MARVALTLAGLLALSAVTPAAAEEVPPRFTVQVDPLTAAIGFLHVQVEYAATPNLSFYLSPHLRLFDGVLPDLQGDYLGLGVEAVVRWFPVGAAPAGWWVGPRGVLARLSSDTDVRLGGYVSVLGGHTWILAGRWVLAAGLGVTYIDYRPDGAGVRGFIPAAHTALGVAF